MKKIFFSTIILASILYAGGGKEMVLGKTKDFAERDMHSPDFTLAFSFPTIHKTCFSRQIRIHS